MRRKSSEGEHAPSQKAKAPYSSDAPQNYRVKVLFRAHSGHQQETFQAKV